MANSKSHKSKQSLISHGYLFVAPAVILIFLLAVFPSLRIIYLSLHSRALGTQVSEFVWLKNYIDILSDPNLWNAFKNTLYFTGFGTLGHLTLGLLIALVMNAKLNRRFLTVCRSLFLLPWAITPVVVGVITQIWVNPLISPIAKVLRMIGLSVEFAPLAKIETALPTLTFIHIWHITPFYMLMILAGLQSLDPYLTDAANVDGASFFQKIRFVIIPHLWELMITLAMFDIFITAAYFTLVWVTTGGGPVNSTDVLATYIYRLAFGSLNFNKASAAGIVLIGLYIVISFIFIKLMRRD